MSWSIKPHSGVIGHLAGHDEKIVENGKQVVVGGYAHHFTPAHSRSVFRIDWQNTLVDRKAGQAPNGAFVEDVLEACARRLEAYQGSSFACSENAHAIAHIRESIGALVARRENRRERGVEGKNEE